MTKQVRVESMDDGRNVRCPRCWHWHGVIENFDGLCDGCQQLILKNFPGHASAPLIREARATQRMKYTV